MATIQIPQGANLSSLAKQYNTTVPDFLKANPNITNPNLIQAGAQLNLPQATVASTPPVQVSESFSADSVVNKSTFTPVDVPTTTPVDPFIKGLEESNKQVQELIKQSQATTQPIEQERSALTSRLESALGKLTGRGDRLAQEEAQLNVPQNMKQLQEINLQIAQKNAEFNQAIVGQEGQGRGRTTAEVSGEQARIRRQQAVEIGGLSAVAQALQGNIALAQQTAERTVNLEFADAEQEVNTLERLLQLNENNFSRADKKRAELLTAQLEERKQTIADQKDARKQVLSLTAEAAQQGADNATLSKMSQARTPEEALQIGGSALGNEFRIKQEQQKFENTVTLQKLALDEASTRAQIANIQSQIADRNNPGGGKQDPAEILAFAQQYASTGKIPTGIPKGSFGLLSQVAKELPKPEGTLVDRNTGVKPDLSPTQEDGITALYDITKKVKELRQLEKERIPGLIPATLGKLVGAKDQQRYVDLRTEIVDLLARARTGAALTAQEEKFYASQLPGRVTRVGFVFGGNAQSRIDNFEQKIEGTLNTKLQTLGGSIYGYSTVKIGDQQFKVGDIVNNGEQNARVNPDGTLTIIQ